MMMIVADECYNEYGNDLECDDWAKDDECQYNRDWMMFYCKKSCLKCDGVTRRLREFSLPVHLSRRTACIVTFPETNCFLDSKTFFKSKKFMI